MKYSFNLVDQPWISCLDQLGLTKELSIKQTFGQAHELRGFQGESPLVNAALYRLLLAFLHRLFGPANMNEWNKLWHAGKFDMSRIKDDKIVIMIGKRGTGKSWLIRDILYHHRDIPVGAVIIACSSVKMGICVICTADTVALTQYAD